MRNILILLVLAQLGIGGRDGAEKQHKENSKAISSETTRFLAGSVSRVFAAFVSGGLP